MENLRLCNLFTFSFLRFQNSKLKKKETKIFLRKKKILFFLVGTTKEQKTVDQNFTIEISYCLDFSVISINTFAIPLLEKTFFLFLKYFIFKSHFAYSKKYILLFILYVFFHFFFTFILCILKKCKSNIFFQVKRKKILN